MYTYEQMVFVKDPFTNREAPQTIRVKANNPIDARRIMSAYGRVAGLPIRVG
jgi:hypothetical protein